MKDPYENFNPIQCAERYFGAGLIAGAALAAIGLGIGWIINQTFFR